MLNTRFTELVGCSVPIQQAGMGAVAPPELAAAVSEAGGLGMLKALGSVFPDVTFCPTGGLTVESAPEFLALPNVACVGGSWLTPQDAIKAGDWAKITALARTASALSGKAR